MASQTHHTTGAATDGTTANTAATSAIPHQQQHDPSLDISNQHHHPHTHHAASATPDEKHSPAYVVGTTLDPSTVPNSSDSFHRKSQDYSRPVEKEGAHNITDVEQGHNKSIGTGSVDDHKNHAHDESGKKKGMVGVYYKKYKFVVHILVWLLFTAWWIVGLVKHRDFGWVVPFLLYLCVTLRIIFFYVPAGHVMKPIKFIYKNTALRIVSFIPERFRIWIGAFITVAVFCIGAFASEETPGNTRASRAISLFGLLVFIGVLWATSRHRSRIVWQTVVVGMLVQFVVALFVLRTKVGFDIFKFISNLALLLLGFAGDGVAFLTTRDIADTYKFFFFSVLPAIIFFVSLVQLLFYWGIIQWFIGKFAVFFFWAMRVSGAEAVVASASPFIGQGESAMLIRPFIAHLTLAEIHQVMASGFATIAGSVLVAYIGMGVNGQALISSCVMSIPASLAVSKLRFPETEETLTAGRVVIPDDDEHRAANALHAFAEGAWLGLKIAGMILATLLCIIALLGLFNGFIGWWGRYFGMSDPKLSVELIIGYLVYPVAWLLGVPNKDLYQVAKLIGTKLVLNEFVAFNNLTTVKEYMDMDDRSKLIATFALCGFANIGSLGTQIGVLSQLAPSRGGDVSRVAFSALITGAISTLTSAAIAGMLVVDPSAFTTVGPKA